MANKKILVVEDEAIVAIDIAEDLRALGYEVCGLAVSGAEAIAWAEREMPDLVLMDIRLQGKMSGIDAARIIGEKIDLPVVFLTAHSDEATLQSAKEAHPLAYLLKPFSVKELRASIEMALYKAEAERSLAKSEKWNRAIVESLQSAFVVIDANASIIGWNPWAESMFGWSHNETMGKRFVDLIIPERLREMYQRGVSRFFETGASDFLNRTMEQYGVCRDGRELPIEITLSAAELDGQPRLFGLINDISKRRQYEIQRAKFEELERANRDLERFAHLASHDLQEPLRTISLYAQLLHNRAGAKLAGEEKEMLEHMVRGSKRLSLLIEQLLNYSRVGTADNFEAQELASQEVVEAALASLETLLTSTTDVVVRCGKLPRVSGNSVQLEEVFQNLITNAIKFRANRPLVIEIAAARIGEFWQFSVKDNGLGFDQRYAEHIFEMFKRVHVDPKYQGTGAGLAICKKIIALHGGRIWAESEAGVGSSFFFTLPAVERMKTQGVLDGMRILIVDNAIETKTLVAHLLNGTGAEIELAENGFAALDLVRAAHFDLVLMDIEMPGLSGLETTLRMKQDGLQIPVVAFTNSSIVNIKHQIPGDAFTEFLSKSAPPNFMIQQLRMWYPPAYLTETT